MIELECAVQKYAWGKRGESSAVARIKRASDASFALSELEPYAEIWMGTHPSGPSKVRETGVPLLEWLQVESSSGTGVVGLVPEGYPANDIPYMFKVLSIQTALSIQAHPDKHFAPILHATQPEIYKDPNHKPEMCIALTSLEALKGFRPCREIEANLASFPELRDLIGDEAAAAFLQLGGAEGQDQSESKALETVFGAFLRCPVERASACVSSIVSRLTAVRGGTSLDYLSDLILRLHDDYPGDPGIFCPLILNCLELKPGEAFFMQANEPHAYIKGDIVEVMALSDNVVRAGLTPKFKDVETMCKMLEYKCITPNLSLVVPIQLDAYCSLYRPPPSSCQEFEVELVALPANAPAYVLAAQPCSSILLFMHGNLAAYSSATKPTTQLYDGAVFFLAANETIELFPGAADVTFYRSHVNLGAV